MRKTNLVTIVWQDKVQVGREGGKNRERGNGKWGNITVIKGNGGEREREGMRERR